MPVTVNLKDGPGVAKEILGTLEDAEQDKFLKIMVRMSQFPNVAHKTEELSSISGFSLAKTIDLMKRYAEVERHIERTDQGWVWHTEHRKEATPMVDQTYTFEQVKDMIVQQDIDTFDVSVLPKRQRPGTSPGVAGTIDRRCPFCELWFGSQGVRRHMKHCEKNPNREPKYSERQSTKGTPEYNKKLEKDRARKTATVKRGRPRKATSKVSKTARAVRREVDRDAARELAAQKSTQMSRDIIKYMQDHENEYVTLEDLQSMFGPKATQSMSNIVRSVPEISRVRKGLYLFTRATPRLDALVSQPSVVETVAQGLGQVVKVDQDTIVVIYEGGVYRGTRIG